MTAYVVVDITVTDPVGYEEYKKLAPAAVELCGRKYIARGGQTETLEVTGHRTGLLFCNLIM
jgi:uncharacterized protein (DUF1330 family)